MAFFAGSKRRRAPTFDSETDLFYHPNPIIDPAGSSSLYHRQVFGIVEQRKPTILLSLGDGSVIWTIWPSILFYTTLAVVVTLLVRLGGYDLGIANTMLTVIGLVVGFALSYRTSTAYSCYWEGRCCWANISNQSRSLCRLIWLHVKCIDPRYPPGHSDAEVEAVKGLVEKLTMINLLLGYSVAIKHHIRGELGPYFADLFPLVGALPKYASMTMRMHTLPTQPSHAPLDTANPATSNGASTSTAPADSTTPTKRLLNRTSAISLHARSSSLPDPSTVPLLPPPPIHPNAPSSKDPHVVLNLHPSFPPLLPAALPPESNHSLWDILTIRKPKADRPAQNDPVRDAEEAAKAYKRRRGRHHRPAVAGGGENLPLEVLLYLSTYIGELEERGTATGPVIGQMYSCLNSLSEQLASLEKVLTTPLPFAYACHLRHIVWIYLLLLPVQLTPTLGWLTIPSVAIASFFFLGFLAISEEIENPFQYQLNDLPIDLYCRILQRNLREITSHASLHRDVSEFLTPHHSSNPKSAFSLFPSPSTASDTDKKKSDDTLASIKSYYASHAHTRWIFSNCNYPLFPLDKRSAAELVHGTRIGSGAPEGQSGKVGVGVNGGKLGMKATVVEIDAILGRGPDAWEAEVSAANGGHV